MNTQTTSQKLIITNNLLEYAIKNGDTIKVYQYHSICEECIRELNRYTK